MQRSGNDYRATTRELGKLKEDVAKLAQQLSNVTDTATEETLEKFRGQVLRVKSELNDVFGEFGDRSRSAGAAVRDIGDTLSDAVEETMQQHPLTTLGLALGVGFLAGAAWRR